jgi:hypothetical protein
MIFTFPISIYCILVVKKSALKKAAACAHLKESRSIRPKPIQSSG